MAKIKKMNFNIDQTLVMTVRMIRQSWESAVCVFFQLDDHGDLRVRASDGLPPAVAKRGMIRQGDGVVSECMASNRIVTTENQPWEKDLKGVFDKNGNSKGKKYVIVPVAGQSRVLGVLVLGPFSAKKDFSKFDEPLRRAATLCAVLSAYVRLYEWTLKFLPQFNHDLRTPLSAVQGSLGMVLGGVVGDVDEEAKSMLEIANRGCVRTVKAIEEFINTQNERLPKPE